MSFIKSFCCYLSEYKLSSSEEGRGGCEPSVLSSTCTESQSPSALAVSLIPSSIPGAQLHQHLQNPAPWTALATLWSLAASNANILSWIPVAFSLGDTHSLNGSQKNTVVTINWQVWQMPADVKWTHCVCLTGSSQKLSSRVCGFFWDHCNSFYMSQVNSNRGSFLDREHQKEHEETWGYCRGSLHRWLNAARLQCCCFVNKQLHSFPQMAQEKLFSLTGLLEVLSCAAGQTWNKEESSRQHSWDTTSVIS